MRDHGGNIDDAIDRYGGSSDSWVDLSTGINARPYPLPNITARAWTALPTQKSKTELIQAAAHAYATTASILPVAGAQAAIQMIPHLLPVGHARVLGPTYNEHAASLRNAGWAVEEVSTPLALAGADLAVIVNPNNPDGREMTPKYVMALAEQVGFLVVDESFADARPDLSIAPLLKPHMSRIVVLRSFGKFYGLAGVRLGFALGSADRISVLRNMAGPWPVSGPAIEIAKEALADQIWHQATVERLAEDTERLDRLASSVGWKLIGGTGLFRTYDVGLAQPIQDELARAHIWSRVFPYAPGWLRLGLPGDSDDWARLVLTFGAD